MKKVSQLILNESTISKECAGIKTYHVWAVGRVLYVGAAVIWNFGLSSENPPGGNWEHPVVNCSSRAMCSSVKLATIVQNQSNTWRLKTERDQIERAEKTHIWHGRFKILKIG